MNVVSLTYLEDKNLTESFLFLLFLQPFHQWKEETLWSPNHRQRIAAIKEGWEQKRSHEEEAQMVI